VLGKGNKERLVPVSLACRKHLWHQLRAVAPNGWIFATRSGARLSYRNAHRDLTLLCRAAGVQHRQTNPHAFRHCFAVTYIRRGGDIYRLSRLLGHASISTTQIYLRSMGIEHLREAHDSFSPLTAP
jgi:integrase/recombinase XerD